MKKKKHRLHGHGYIVTTHCYSLSDVLAFVPLIFFLASNVDNRDKTENKL
jgi:hypothetical protein